MEGENEGEGERENSGRRMEFRGDVGKGNWDEEWKGLEDGKGMKR